MSPLRLQDKVCIVTGASSGIGRAIALRYARHGAKVVCADLLPNARAEVPDEKMTTTHDMIKESGGKSIFVRTDVTKVQDVKNLVSQAVAEFRTIDVLVNNAGISVESKREPLKLHETSENDWDQTMDVNVSNDSGDRGWIINLSSIYGLVGGVNNTCYAASKGAVTNLTRSIALDYASTGIHCNAICPGYTHTAIFEDTIANMDDRNALGSRHPLKGVGKPNDIVGAAVFLASEDASWITGVNLPVDGGFTCQ